MLTRRFRRGQESDREKTVAQDGFSATIDGAVPAVSPRPWHDDTTPFKPISEEMLQQMMYGDAPAAQQAAAPVQPSSVQPSSVQPSPVHPSPANQVFSAQAARGAYRAPAGWVAVGRHALDFADNGDGTLTLVRCIDPQIDDLDIQFDAGACPVVAIAPKAFEGCVALRRVVLPPALRQIGEKAFSGCVHLMQLVIPGTVERVGTLAFANCASLARVRIEPGVQALGPSCFSKCTSLVRVDTPSSLAGFGGGVFFGCGRQLCLYGAEGAPAQQYARLNGIAYDSQSWKEDETLVFEELEEGSLVVMGPRQSAPERIDIPAEMGACVRLSKEEAKLLYDLLYKIIGNIR